MQVIFLVSEREVLRYFTDQMRAGAEQAGISYYMADMANPDTLRTQQFLSFLTSKRSIFVTFNQSTAMPTWDRLGIPVCNYIVDHPRYFSDILSSGMKHLYPVVIDRNHGSFIRRYFPETNPPLFLPNGGTTEYLPGRNGLLPYADRDIAVLYCGNCQDGHLPLRDFPFLKHDVHSLFEECVAAMKADPSPTTEEAMEVYLDDREDALSPDEKRQVIFLAARPVEEAVRRHFKLRTVHALDKAGIRMEIYGDGWYGDDCHFSDRIQIHPRVSSAECNRLAERSKISLNFCPWYKDGCSERVFNNMLNGSVCVSDKSLYLSERFTDDKELVFFDMEKEAETAARISHLLSNDTEAAQIARCGFEAASAHDTWPHRLLQLCDKMKTVLP